MSRMEVPFKRVILVQTGDLLLLAEVDLWLKDGSGNWVLQTFRVDSGSDISAMPAYRAKALGLPMPQMGVMVPLNMATGSQPMLVRSGTLEIKVNGLSPKEHTIPCHFRGDPDLPPAPGSHGAIPRNLLGLSGVIDKLRFTFDGTPLSAAAPNGVLVVEDI